LAQRQETILARLANALKMEQAARGQTATLEIQHQQVGHLAKADLDRLQGVELNQRQIHRDLTDPASGVVSLIQSLLFDLQSNHINSPDMERRMRGLLADLNSLEREHLPLVERELTGAIKGAQNIAEVPGNIRQPDPLVARSLQSALEHADVVIATLEKWLGNLQQWDNYRRFAKEISQFRAEQNELAGETTNFRTETISKDFKDLSPQQQADLRKTTLVAALKNYCNKWTP
jgi:hypothetical protein